MIVRPGYRERLFPRPAELAEGALAKSGPETAEKIISLQDKKLSRRGLAAGRGLSGHDHVGRLLRHQQLALQAEKEGRWQSADTYWSIVNEEVAALDQAPVGAALASTVGSAEEATKRLVDEILIDGHLALLDGVGENPTRPAAARGLVQIERIVTLLPRSGLAPDHRAELAEQLARRAVSLASESRRGEQATETCARLLSFCTSSVTLSQARADSELIAAFQAIEGETDAAAAARLAAHIRRLTALKDADDQDLALYDAIGVLQRALAVRLAQSDRLNEGLVAAKTAQLYGPGAEADDLMRQCIEEMERRIAQADTLIQDLKKNGQTLSAAGHLFVADANTGFEPLRRLVESFELESIIEARTRAVALRIWRLAKQAEPTHCEAPAALLKVMNQTDAASSDDETPLAERLRLAAADEPQLATVDWDGVSRLMRGDAVEVLERELADGFTIAVPGEAAKQDEVPFVYAFFGRSGGGLRLLVAVAALMLATAGGLAAYDWLQSRTRDAAYERLTAADRQDDDRAALAAAVDFRSHRPLLRLDGRTDGVDKIEIRAREAPNKRLRDAAYASLTAAAARNDDAIALDQAARFLEAPPVAVPDARTAQVMSLLDRHFLMWLPTTRGRLDGPAKATIDRYKTLAARYPDRKV